MFVEDKANGESLDGFVEFLGTMPADDIYQWTDSSRCACARYLKSIGRFKEDWLHDATVMGELNRIARGDWDHGKWDGAGGYKETEWTFGKCLERAKKVKEAA